MCQRPRGQCFDLRKRQELNKITSNITEPAVLLNKVINAIKVSENNTRYCENLIVMMRITFMFFCTVLGVAYKEVRADTRKATG